MDCRVTVLLASVTLLACVSHCLGDEPTAQPCRECAERKRLADEILSSEELRQARIELIKRQILQKLRLSEPPRPSRPILPSVITSQGILSNSNNLLSDDNIDEYYGTTENVVLFPDNTTADGVRRRGVPWTRMRFHLDQLTSFTPGRPTAHLWVYRNQQNSSNITYVLYDIQPATSTTEFRERLLHVDHVIGHSLPSWHRYDITPSLGNWLRSGQTRSFDIDCHGCITDPIGKIADKRPFIVISADPSRHSQRSKRSIKCTSGTSHCCRETFYLSFREIGWNDWIIQPPGYTANFCRGSCEDDISISRYHHTSLMQQVIQGQRAKQTNVTVSLCCTPSKMSSIMLIYVDKDGPIYQKRMPNMVVEACDCA
uniref:Myostatin n=1 Tax=Hadrurus spadix TaxID=141984 RepID=A0A1W7RA62_9SCOR